MIIRLEEQGLKNSCFFLCMGGWVKEIILLHLIESEIMEEKKNIRELAVQYFEGRIRRKDEKLLFEYVGQSEANRTAFRQWEKEWIASGITDSNTTKEWETLQRKIRTQEAIIPMLGISKTRFSVWRKVAVSK